MKNCWWRGFRLFCLCASVGALASGAGKDSWGCSPWVMGSRCLLLQVCIDGHIGKRPKITWGGGKAAMEYSLYSHSRAHCYAQYGIGMAAAIQLNILPSGINLPHCMSSIILRVQQYMAMAEGKGVPRSAGNCGCNLFPLYYGIRPQILIIYMGSKASRTIGCVLGYR